MKKILTGLLFFLSSFILVGQNIELKEEIIDTKEYFKFNDRIDITKNFLFLIKDLKLIKIQNLTVAKWDDRDWYVNQYKLTSNSINKFGVPTGPNVIKRVKSFLNNIMESEFLVIEYYFNTKKYDEEKSVGVSFYFNPVVGFEKVFCVQFIEPLDLNLFEK